MHKIIDDPSFFYRNFFIKINLIKHIAGGNLGVNNLYLGLNG
jgi:hypothetical protein